MKCLSGRKSKDMLEYILVDYHFLEDYEVLEGHSTNKNSFVARIKDTQQKVRFKKQKYSEDTLSRFKALYQLYTNGIILADNLFILEECQEFFYYVIEAQIALNSTRFQTLQNFLYNNSPSLEESKLILSKIKILVDCLHQQGQAYAGLDLRKIIIDDENNLFLAPFELELQIKTDSYSRAYYSPQILQKISNKDTEISQEMMLKWDIWSFGCLCMEILSYSTPIFLSTSLPKQVKLIQKFTFPQFQEIDESIMNIVRNSLSFNMKLRTISTGRLETEVKDNFQVSRICLQTVANMATVKKQQKVNGTILKQLNIVEQNQGDCLFKLNLFTLSNIKFEKELHVTINIGKKYHFYVDFNEKCPEKYKINRTLTIKESFKQFSKWLSKPIDIYLKQGQKNGKVSVNAQTFVMIHNEQRIWSQPIIGTFSSSNVSDFPKARVKLSCLFQVPQDFKFEQVKVKKNVQNIKACKQIKQTFENIISQKQQKKQISQPLKEVCSNKLEKRSKSTSKIPSISQISQSLSILNEELRRKAIVDHEQEDPIQKQLTSLLDLQ